MRRRRILATLAVVVVVGGGGVLRATQDRTPDPTPAVLADDVGRWVAAAERQVASLVDTNGGVRTFDPNVVPAPDAVRDAVGATLLLVRLSELPAGDGQRFGLDALKQFAGLRARDEVRPLQATRLALQLIDDGQLPPKQGSELARKAAGAARAAATSRDVRGAAVFADAALLLAELVRLDPAYREYVADVRSLRPPCISRSASVFEDLSLLVAVRSMQALGIRPPPCRAAESAVARAVRTLARRGVMLTTEVTPSALAYVQAATHLPRTDAAHRNASSYVAGVLSGQNRLHPTFLAGASRVIAQSTEAFGLEGVAADQVLVSRLRVISVWGGAVTMSSADPPSSAWRPLRIARQRLQRTHGVAALGAAVQATPGLAPRERVFYALALEIDVAAEEIDAALRRQPPATVVEAATMAVLLQASNRACNGVAGTDADSSLLAAAGSSPPLFVWRWAAIARLVCMSQGAIRERVHAAIAPLRTPEGLFADRADGTVAAMTSFLGAVAWCISHGEPPRPEAVNELIRSTIATVPGARPYGGGPVYVGHDQTYALWGLARLTETRCSKLMPAF